MKLQYLRAMQQHGFTENELSHGMRKIVAKLRKLIKAKEEEEHALASVTDASDRAEMTENISRATAAIKEIDADLVVKINKYAPNREKFMAMGKNLLQARGKGGPAATPAAQAPAPVAPDPDPEPEPEPIVQTTQAAPEPTPASQPAATGDEKKSSNLFGWLIGIAAAAVGVYLGVDYYQNRR